MTPKPVLPSRNESLGFAQRALKNLEHIEAAAREQEDVHVVTQRVLSVLGLVAYPWEQGLDQSISGRNLSTLVGRGWPKWKILQGKTTTLGQLVHHLRNAISHRRVWFSSDDRNPTEVEIEFADARTRGAKPYWRARISANDLLIFCRKFVEFVDDAIS
jgi:hypothetical protein